MVTKKAEEEESVHSAGGKKRLLSFMSRLQADLHWHLDSIHEVTGDACAVPSSLRDRSSTYRPSQTPLGPQALMDNESHGQFSTNYTRR